VSLDRTGVAVTVLGEGSSVLSVPTMDSTTAVSALSLMLDHGELIERSYKLRDRRGFQNNAVLYSMGVPHGDAGRMRMYESLWSSLDQLETYMYKAAEYNKWHETTLMARLGGFHALGAMSSVRAMVGGDVMEFGICLTVEVVAGETFVSLSYTPGTDPVDPVLSDEELEGNPEANSTLALLHLSLNQIGDGGTTALADALRANSTLALLHLGLYQIGDGGTTRATAARLTCLDVLSAIRCLCSAAWAKSVDGGMKAARIGGDADSDGRIRAS